MHGRRSWASAALVLLAAVVAGCGEGGDSQTRTQARTQTPARSVATDAPESTKEWAIASLLRESDFDGSRAQGAPISYGPRELRRLEAQAAELPSGGSLLEGCPGVSTPEVRAVAFAMRQLLIEDAGTAVTSITIVFEDATQARAAAATYGQAAGRDCIAEEFKRNMRAVAGQGPDGTRLGRPVARAVEVPAVGDSRSATLVELPVSGGSTRGTLYAEHVVVQDGAALGLATTSTDGTPPPRDAREFVASRVAERLSRTTASSAPASTTATTPPPTTATTPAGAADEKDAAQERALSGLLKPGDLPGIDTEGEAEAIWTEGSNRGRDPGNPFASRCFGGSATWTLLVQARAPRFVIPAGNVQNGIFVFEDAQQASEALRVYERPAARDCFARRAVDQVRTGIRLERDTGTTLGKVRVRTRDLGQIGDESFAMRIALPVRSGGESGTFFLDIVLVRQEEAVGMLSTLVFGESAPDEVLQPLAELAAERLEEVYG